MNVTLTNTGPEMAIFLFAALLGSIVAHKIRQSALVGQIIIGILIGPSILGLVTYNDFVKNVAELGIIMLLFIVGLESKFKDIYNIKNVIIAGFASLFRWAFGYIVARSFGFSNIQALFIGTAITSTSTAVVAAVLKQMGKLKSATGKILMGAGIIDDIFGLILLSIVIKLSEAGMTTQLILSRVLITLAFVMFFFFIGVKISKYLEKLEFWGLRNGYPNIGFIFTLMLAFFYASIAELIGLSAIVGAFVAGLSLEHIENKNFKIGAEYFELIFGSVFFVSLGILTNLKLVFSNINFIIVLTLAAIFSKFFGTYIGSRLSRINNKASEVISVGMIPIGEIAAITALIALNKGIFDSSIYSSVIFVGIITAIYSPVVLKKILGIQIQTKKAFNFKIKHKVSLH